MQQSDITESIDRATVTADEGRWRGGNDGIHGSGSMCQRQDADVAEQKDGPDESTREARPHLPPSPQLSRPYAWPDPRSQ